MPPPVEVDALEPSARFRRAELASEGVDEGAASAEAAEPSAPSRLRALWEQARRAASVLTVVAAVVGASVGGRYAHKWVTHTPRFGAREIEVLGLQRTTRDEALRAAGVQLGTNVLGFDTHRAERMLRALPWVERARVSRRLPGYVRVEVEERRAAALVAAGGLYLCAADGTIFKRAGEGDPMDLPVLTGVPRAEFARDADAARENVRDALALLSDFESSSLAGRERVEEVHREPTGDLSLVLASRGTYVWLGRGGYRAKLARLSAILTELARHELRAAEIHLESDRHPERATVRLPAEARLALAGGEGEGAGSLAPRSASGSSRAAESEGAGLLEVHHRRGPRNRVHPLQTRPAPAGGARAASRGAHSSR